MNLAPVLGTQDDVVVVHDGRLIKSISRRGRTGRTLDEAGGDMACLRIEDALAGPGFEDRRDLGDDAVLDSHVGR